MVKKYTVLDKQMGKRYDGGKSPDSGQVQYTNDGGFIVSKSWRR